ncbi:unnamed protein product, partial [Iphiclides podalirius]
MPSTVVDGKTVVRRRSAIRGAHDAAVRSPVRGAGSGAHPWSRRARYLQNNVGLTCARRRESAGGKTRSRRQSRPESASGRAPNASHASALACDERRARRGVTFSESTANGDTAATEVHCQKVGDPPERSSPTH